MRPPATTFIGPGNRVPACFVFDFHETKQLARFFVQKNRIIMHAVRFQNRFQFRPDRAMPPFILRFRSLAETVAVEVLSGIFLAWAVIVAFVGTASALQAALAGAQAPATVIPSFEDPRIHAIVQAASPERIERDIRTLVGFGTRHTTSDTLSATRGIGAATARMLAQEGARVLSVARRAGAAKSGGRAFGQRRPRGLPDLHQWTGRGQRRTRRRRSGS